MSFSKNDPIVTKHGLYGIRLYTTWQNMKSRCYIKSNTSFGDYGGRGISVCDEWINNFKVFYDWAIANGYSDDLTIDRIDFNGNYYPYNCRWADRIKQGQNKGYRVKNNIGHRGIKLLKSGNFLVRIGANKKAITIGTFTTLEEAIFQRRMSEIYFW